MRSTNLDQSLVNKILFPKSIGLRIFYHLLFWVYFVLQHFSYTLRYLAVGHHDLRVHMFSALYFTKLIPLFYLSVILFDFFNRLWGGVIPFLMVLLSGFIINHLLSTLLYGWIAFELGFELMPVSVRKQGGLYLSFLQLSHSDLWQLFTTGLEEMELLIIPASIKIFKYAIQQNLIRQNAEQETLRTELKLLRSQLTPHFIFNVINAAYAKILPLSEDAAGYLEKVSGILRYALYESEEEFVRLEKEIFCLRQFVDLEVVRNSKRCRISFEQQGDIKSDHRIPTLLLLTLVENAFKHGVHLTRHNSFVDVRAIVASDILKFTITNSIPNRPGMKKNADKAAGGIGLANVKKRLLVYYPGNHQFEKIQMTDRFFISLTLPLYR